MWSRMDKQVQSEMKDQDKMKKLKINNNVYIS